MGAHKLLAAWLAAAAVGLGLVLATASWADAGLPGTRAQGAVSPQPRPPASASLEECVSSTDQEARAVTFAGEMTAIAGTVHMEMRIDLLERASEETLYHRVTAPGLGVWRGSAPGVKSYRYLKQVTNLAVPASYRGLVRFRWLGAHGRLIASSELHTHACEETPLTASTPPSGGSLN